MLTVGMDEVGRGCLAGPVVACAVILPEDFSDDRLIDSKKLSEKKRKLLDTVVRAHALSIGIGIVDNGTIDEINILNATKMAMKQALSQMTVEYQKVIIDAVNLDGVTVPMEHPFQAEDKYQCVAAASIVAKVFRDNLMAKLHTDYPDYDWYSNKGYGTKKHTDAIRQIGLSPLHRVTFCGNFI